VLLAKQRAGAEFAITDMVFSADDYVGLVERARAIGVEIPILPGIMPILSLRQVARMAELSGHPVPVRVRARLAPLEDDPAALRAEGIAMAAELCDELLERGAPGLHFYTLNRSKATREIFAALQICA
jgi:methylenetetrahydrofolate reductase (NADPH)